MFLKKYINMKSNTRSNIRFGRQSGKSYMSMALLKALKAFNYAIKHETRYRTSQGNSFRTISKINER